jgi:flagellar basal body-associated protein FliL
MKGEKEIGIIIIIIIRSIHLAAVVFHTCRFNRYNSLCGLGYSATVLVAVELPDGSLYIYWIGVKELTTNLASSNFSVATIVNMAQDLYVSRLLDINTEGDERLWDKNLYYGDAVPETEVPASSAQYSFHALEFMQPPQPPYVVAYPLGTFSFKGGARYVGVIIGSTSLAPDNGPRLVFVPVNEPSENRTKIIIIAVITSVGGVLLIAGLVLIGHRMMTRRRYD